MTFFDRQSAFGQEWRKRKAMSLDPYSPHHREPTDPLGPMPLAPGQVAVPRELLERVHVTLDRMTASHDPGRGPRTAASEVLDDAVDIRNEVADLLA